MLSVVGGSGFALDEAGREDVQCCLTIWRRCMHVSGAETASERTGRSADASSCFRNWPRDSQPFKSVAARIMAHSPRARFSDVVRALADWPDFDVDSVIIMLRVDGCGGAIDARPTIYRRSWQSGIDTLSRFLQKRLSGSVIRWPEPNSNVRERVCHHPGPGQLPANHAKTRE